MKHKALRDARFFFTTAPMPCPYLPGLVERRLVTELAGRDAAAYHDALSRAGFRRSHGIAYVPICPDCSACATVRIVAAEAKRTRSQKRVWTLNQDLEVAEVPTHATGEQYEVFADYQRSRHGDGDMARMDAHDYQALVEDTPVRSSILEFRDGDDRLVAACVIDHLSDGPSAVYSFFDPAQSRRSLGTYMILWLIEYANAGDLPYVYLGFWVADSRKMSYKSRFRPIEAFTPEGWRSLDPGSPEAKRLFAPGADRINR